jgi:hypothetical protein
VTSGPTVTEETRAEDLSLVESAAGLVRALGLGGMRLLKVIREKGLALINELQSEGEAAAKTDEKRK